MHPDTDIVITCRITREFAHVEEDITKCVETLKHHTHAFRPIFVDDDSDQQGSAVIQSLAAQFPYGLYIKTNHQRWFTRAVNLGLRMIRTPYAAVLNCDTLYGTGWLEELYSVKDEVESTVGKVGFIGSVLNGDEPRRYMLSVGQDYVTGHAWLLNMQAMYEVSAVRGTHGYYLDETHPHNIHIRSDVAICWDLNKLGWQCVKSFKSAVGHLSGRTWGHQLGRIPGS